MQKHFVREHGGRGAKASNRRVGLRGKKEGSGGRIAKFMVAASYSKSIVKCYQY